MKDWVVDIVIIHADQCTVKDRIMVKGYTIRNAIEAAHKRLGNYFGEGKKSRTVITGIHLLEEEESIDLESQNRGSRS